MRKFILTVGILFFCSEVLATNSITYKNSRGSLLKLRINTDHTLSGTFTSAVASKECPQAIGLVRPIVGYIAKNALTLSVFYPECGVVNFIGNIEENKNIIDTTFIVAHPAYHVARVEPGYQMIGHDVFIKVK